MSNQRKVYTLHGLTPEVRAVTFAKCSRSPESFNQIACELTEAKSSEFHEKWVVGYGHSSVAEHAVLSIALENVSILATKVIEDNRLASYTEKSTRYQVFTSDRVYLPPKIANSKFNSYFTETYNYLFQVYADLYQKVEKYFLETNPQKPDQPDSLYQTIIKGLTCDVVRNTLPVGTLTNLGMTANARVLEHAIVKMLSHPLEEIRQIGEEIKAAGTKVVPTLIKYTEPNEYLMTTEKLIGNQSRQKLADLEPNEQKPVVLVHYDRQAEAKIVASLLYKYSRLPYVQIRQQVEKMSETDKAEIIDRALKNRGKFDAPVRELEHAFYTFDLLLDYGAFRDIQRHRLCTQTNQSITTDHGYAVPDKLAELNLAAPFERAMARAKEAYDKISPEFPAEAQYLVPMAFKKRVLMTMNLRELHHFIKLRSGSRGHISYRRIAQQCWQELNKVQPTLAKYIEVDWS